MPQKKAVNPFYVLLVIVGVVFGLTACAYGVMTVKMSTAAGIAENLDSPAIRFLNDHGLVVLAVEIALLALTTFAAMGTDSYWTKDKP